MVIPLDRSSILAINFASRFTVVRLYVMKKRERTKWFVYFELDFKMFPLYFPN